MGIRLHSLTGASNAERQTGEHSLSVDLTTTDNLGCREKTVLLRHVHRRGDFQSTRKPPRRNPDVPAALPHRPMGHRDGPANPAFPTDLHQAPHALRPSEVHSGNDPQGERCLTFAESLRITKKPAHSTSRSARKALLTKISFSQRQEISVRYLKCVAWTSNASTEIPLTVLPSGLNPRSNSSTRNSASTSTSSGSTTRPSR